MATTMTYKEQLLHPYWQKKRLEVLDAYKFKCSTCDSAEKTLHVHHKHYVKGRQAWEYELGELEPLCVDCHKEAHDEKERIDRVVSQFPTCMWSALADVLVGYGEDYVDPAEWAFVEGPQPRGGQMAWHMGNFSDAQALHIVDIFMQIGPDRFLDALKAEVEKDFSNA